MSPLNLAINIGSTNRQDIVTGMTAAEREALVRPYADLSETQKKLISRLENDLDLNQRQIRAALEILGEANILPENYGTKLVDIAERFKSLQEIASTLPGDSHKTTALKAKAQEAIKAGELAEADALLAQVETEQRRFLDLLAANAAETSAERGEIALTRLRYTDAAKHFANAAGTFPPDSTHEDRRIGYLEREASALYQQGDEFGVNGALLSAIERYKRLVEMMTSERVPLDWARTQMNLGNALATLGERESGTVKLEEAVVAYRAALKDMTRARVPLDWAITQNNLGNALLELGERESGTARLEEAVEAYREALEERTRERVPLQWAMTQNNLGNALQTLGERESGMAKLEEAVAAYRAALQELTRERAPLQWATTQNNLGAALRVLGERESGTARLEEAVVAFREALQEWTRERVPLQWAWTQMNLGHALRVLGERESGTVKLEEAVSAYREALKEMTREAAPHWHDIAQRNLASCLVLLEQRRRS